MLVMFHVERFDSAKRAIKNLFSDGRGAKRTLKKNVLFKPKAEAMFLHRLCWGE